MSGTLPPISGHPNVTGLGPDLASAFFGFPSGWLLFFGLIMGILIMGILVGILVGFHLSRVISSWPRRGSL